MWRLLFKTLRTGIVTSSYPKRPDVPPGNFRGLPVLDATRCEGHAQCVQACPVGALRSAAAESPELVLDASSCMFCGLCVEACPAGALRMGGAFELAGKSKEDLFIRLSTGKTSC